MLANGRAPLCALLYGLSVVRKRVGRSPSERDLGAVQELTTAHAALRRYLRFRPSDLLASQLALAVMERIHAFDEGIRVSRRGLVNYSGARNNSDSAPYARAQAQLARLYLGAGRYPEAAEAGDAAAEILAEDESMSGESQKSLMSSLAVSGLSLYFSGDFDASLAQLATVLDVFPDSSRLVVLIAQVLHASGRPDARQAAVDELMKSIEKYGTSPLVASTVASIALVDRLDDFLPAAREELLLMPVDARAADISCEIPGLVDKIDRRLGLRAHSRLWQREAFLFPGQAAAWRHLDSHVALNVASQSGDTDSGVLAESYVRAGTLREIQRGLFLDPGNVNGYRALRGCFA